MTNPYASYEKDGYKTLLNLAKTLCRLVNQWQPIISAKYGDNIAMMALLTAVIGLCELIPAADGAFIEATLIPTPPAENVEDIAGFDPSAPPAEDPELS